MITVRLPGALRVHAGDSSAVPVDGDPPTVAAALDVLQQTHPALERRIRDERGRLRVFVNIYVDGTDIRDAGGLAAAVPPGGEILVVPSVAGG